MATHQVGEGEKTRNSIYPNLPQYVNTMYFGISMGGRLGDRKYREWKGIWVNRAFFFHRKGVVMASGISLCD